MYAQLSIAVEGCECVRFPDGTTAVVRPGAGAALAASWRPSIEATEDEASSARLSHAEAEKAKWERYEAELAQWEAELGRRLDGIWTVTQGREIREAFEREHPRPQLARSLGSGQAVAELDRPTVDRSQWWFASCPEAAVNSPLSPSTEPFPRVALAKVLTDLEADGWIMVHVSEERAVEHEDSISRTMVVGASILLHRPPE